MIVFKLAIWILNVYVYLYFIFIKIIHLTYDFEHWTWLPERHRRQFLMRWCLNLIELCAGQWSVMFGPATNDIFQWGTQIFPGCFLMSVTSVQKFLFVFLVEWNKVFPTCRPASCSPLETVLTVSAAEDVAGTMYICVATPGHGEFIHTQCLS